MTQSEAYERGERARSVVAGQKMELAFRCVDVPDRGPVLDAFMETLDKAREVSFSTFASKVDWKPVAKMLGYEVGPNAKGLTLDKDYHVRFHSSKHMGERVYFMVHSGIEFVFKKPSEVEPQVRLKMRTPWS